jgi:hypothetical protein
LRADFAERVDFKFTYLHNRGRLLFYVRPWGATLPILIERAILRALRFIKILLPIRVFSRVDSFNLYLEIIRHRDVFFSVDHLVLKTLVAENRTGRVGLAVVEVLEVVAGGDVDLAQGYFGV